MVKERKVIKRIISYILVFALCVPVLGFSTDTKIAEAEENILYFTWQDGLGWGYTDNGDGTVTVGLKNYRADLAADLIKFNQKYPKPSDIKVPKYLDGKLVTGVSWLLEPYVENIILPDSIKNIYWGAFSSVGAKTYLESVTITSDVEYMEDGCFNWDYKGVIYTIWTPEVYIYAALNGIKYYIIEKPEEVVAPAPTAEPAPTIEPASAVTKRPVITVTETTKRPIIPAEEKTPAPAAKTPEVTVPVITVTSVPASIAPDITPSPSVKSTPEILYTQKPDFQGKTPSPEPEYTSKPDFPEKETSSPEYTDSSKETLSPENTQEPLETVSPGIQIKVTPSELRADSQGSFYDNKISISVSGADNYSIDAGTSSWLKVGKGNSLSYAMEKIVFTGNNYNSFYVFADRNTNTSARTGNITITANNGERKEKRTIKVKQEAADTRLSISVSKITANAKGDTSVSSVNVKTYNSGGFLVDNCGYSWIETGNCNSAESASSNISFENEGTFYVFISENTSNKARSGKIKIKHENGSAEEIINVSQEGKRTVLNVETERKTADNKGVFYNNAVSVQTSGTGSFTATVEDACWLKISSKSTASFLDGMAAITLDKDSNIYLFADINTGEERTAVISITHESGNITKEIEVIQMGKDKSYLYTNRETAYFDEPVQSTSEMVTVSADEGTNWTAASSNNWIKIIKSGGTQKEQYASIEGMGDGGFYILVKENNTYKERSGYITISAPGLEDCEIYVYQAENEISLDTLLAELSINVSKKTFKKGKTSKIKLDYPEGLYASDMKSVKFSSNKKKVATVSSNGVIKGVKKGKAVITVKVTLENGSSKTFKAKITVDKRKVKLSKFK